MRIADICTRNAIHIDTGESVRDAAELMRQRHVGSLVAVAKSDGERVPVGMLTDRDIVVAIVALGIAPDTVTVGDTMTTPLASCTDEDDLFDAIATMRRRGVRRLPVTSRATGRLMGIVSADDIYGALGLHLRDLSSALTREQVHEMEARP